MRSLRTILPTCVAIVVLALVAGTGCSDGDDIDSDTEARWSYLGLDRAIDRAINLGFDGFNAANSANIPTQSGVGDVDGTMDVDGQVDQGASDNKGMRLLLTLVEYTDDVVDDPVTEEDTEELVLIYDTIEDMPPSLDMSLRDIPDGTFTGTLIGDFLVSGDLDATGTFNLALSGSIQEDPMNAGEVIREPGTLIITGTVTSGDGVYDVDVMK
jgi:hypothetical protein